MNQIFSDTKLQSHYDEHGYVVVQLFDKKIIEALLDAYNKLDNQSLTPFHSTLHNTDILYRKAVYKSIVEIAGDKICSVFLNPWIITSSFVVKEAHEESHVVIHQDWNLTDENLLPGFNAWFPLVNTNEHNGALYILPGSHKARQIYRGTNTNNPLEYCSHININHLKKIELLAGEVIIYDVRLLHGSPPNKSNSPRIACAVGVVPKESELIHFKFDDHQNSLIEYVVNSDFYFNYNPSAEFFSTLKIKGKKSLSKPWEPKELDKFLRTPTKNSFFSRIFTSIKGR